MVRLTSFMPIGIKKRNASMKARQKLNKAFFNGSLVVATVVGIVTDSWQAFGLTLLVLLAIHLCAGEIRLSKRR